MKVYLLDEEKLKEEKLISLDKFKVEPDRSLTESDVDVYLKVILNKTVHDLIDRQKN